MATKLQIRRDTASNWTSANPTLSAGEFGFETDTYKLKIGDGSTAWTSLDYYADQLAGGVDSAGIISLLGNGSVQHIIPSGNELYDLGDSNSRFRDLYLSGSSIKLGTATITADSAGTLTLPAGTQIGSGAVLDSANVLSLISASYIQSNQTTYNNNDFADSAFVTTQINNLIDGAPGTLNTLNEIAAALNDDDSAYGTLLGLINAKTDYDSADTLGLIDSAYIQARQSSVGSGGVDSAATLALIDSDYVSARVPSNLNTGFQWYSYTATAGQTTFQDSDNSGNILSYDPNGVLVFYNGVLLTPSDITANNGSSVVLGTGADSGTNIAITKWNTGGGAFDIPWGGDRALAYIGFTGASSNVIEYYDITTAGNSTDFGDTLLSSRNGNCVGDGTYVLLGGGNDGGTKLNTIQYNTVATTGNSIDVGDLTQSRLGLAAAGDGTYGLWAGGNTGSLVNTIDYITISTSTNASNFGDLTATSADTAGVSGTTNAVFHRGNEFTATNVLDYVTIASPGNASDFGDLSLSRAVVAGTASDITRGVFAGGWDGSNGVNTIDYITVSTPGNATDFGDMTAEKYNARQGAGNGTYGTFAGSQLGVGASTIDRITIQTPGNATDHGDLSVKSYYTNGSGSGSPS